MEGAMPPSRRRSPELVVPFSIEHAILTVRGQRVMVDADLAALYGVTTKALNQALKRNRKRFPDDFVFQLTREEKRELVTDCDRFTRLKHSTALPHAFTEHGAVMAASVLNSEAAVRASVFVVRAFVRMRAVLASNREFAERLSELERTVGTHDTAIRELVAAIRLLAAPPEGERERIGFRPRRKGDR
jgi:hypothetical protein